MRDSKGRLVPG